jgi:hypothetical protein
VHIDDGRRERLSILTAIESALADPVRLLGILLDSEDDDDAIDRLIDAFGVDAAQAQAMLDLQFRRVIPANRARLADELRVLRAEWGPPVVAHIEFTGRRSAVLSIDGAEHSYAPGMSRASWTRSGTSSSTRSPSPRSGRSWPASPASLKDLSG